MAHDKQHKKWMVEFQLEMGGDSEGSEPGKATRSELMSDRELDKALDHIAAERVAGREVTFRLATEKDRQAAQQKEQGREQGGDAPWGQREEAGRRESHQVQERMLRQAEQGVKAAQGPAHEKGPDPLDRQMSEHTEQQAGAARAEPQRDTPNGAANGAVMEMER